MIGATCSKNCPAGLFRSSGSPTTTRPWALFASGAYDVYLLDFRLGRHSGLDLLREVRRLGVSAPIILLTGQGQRELDHAAMQAGAADYLEKSRLDATLLERAIRYALQQKRYEEQLNRQVRERTAELAKANQALREADRRKDEFLATLAHELRNPLAPLRNALEIMRLSGHKPDAIETCRGMIDRQVKQLVRLIDDLLEISRVTRGKIELRRENVDLRTVVDAAVEASRPLLDAQRLHLEVIQPPRAVALSADPLRLTQVLTNLLNNSAKFTEPGGSVRVTAAGEGGEAVVRVRDTGVGIAAEELPHIFTMFAQVDRNRERSQGGLGIGLALVRGLIELHGGTVAAHSDGPGTGTEFVVRLPAGERADAAGLDRGYLRSSWAFLTASWRFRHALSRRSFVLSQASRPSLLPSSAAIRLKSSCFASRSCTAFSILAFVSPAAVLARSRSSSIFLSVSG